MYGRPTFSPGFGNPNYLGRGFDHSRVAGPTTNTTLGLGRSGAYGDEAADAAAQAKKDQVQGFILDAANKFLFTEDDPGVLAAKIANYRQKMVTPPFSFFPGKAWYQAEINKMEAQLASASAASGAIADWRSLGQTGAAVGIIAGIGIVALIGAATYKTIKSTPKRNPRRRASRRRARK